MSYRYVELHGHRVLVRSTSPGRHAPIETRGSGSRVLTEAVPKPTKWDKMDQATLRKHIAKYKAMGAKAPALPMLRATQALARKLALAENWAEWDAMHHSPNNKFYGMKAGPMPKTTKSGAPAWGAGLDSPGRGPSGKLRNFKAMSDFKLKDTLDALKVHGEDHEALSAAQSEWDSRGQASMIGNAADAAIHRVLSKGKLPVAEPRDDGQLVFQ